MIGKQKGITPQIFFLREISLTGYTVYLLLIFAHIYKATELSIWKLRSKTFH